MVQYANKTKAMIQCEYKTGVGVRELSRKYEISRYAIQSWCGLRPEVERRHAAPLPKGRPKNKRSNDQALENGSPTDGGRDRDPDLGQIGTVSVRNPKRRCKEKDIPAKEKTGRSRK